MQWPSGFLRLSRGEQSFALPTSSSKSSSSFAAEKTPTALSCQYLLAAIGHCNVAQHCLRGCCRNVAEGHCCVATNVAGNFGARFSNLIHLKYIFCCVAAAAHKFTHLACDWCQNKCIHECIQGLQKRKTTWDKDKSKRKCWKFH